MKNTMLSPVSADLGLGTTLGTQVQDALEEEKRRKMLLGQGTGSTVARDLGLAPIGMGTTY
jgi:hypothetical protein